MESMSELQKDLHWEICTSEGVLLGIRDGLNVGDSEENALGVTDSPLLGDVEGWLLGLRDGLNLGDSEENPLGLQKECY